MTALAPLITSGTHIAPDGWHTRSRFDVLVRGGYIIGALDVVRLNVAQSHEPPYEWIAESTTDGS